MPEFWEPRQFKVGDRVRVRLSPECPCYAVRMAWYPTGLNGGTGTIISLEWEWELPRTGIWLTFPGLSDSHHIQVEFSLNSESLSAVMLAASEIEPLDPAPVTR